MNPERDISTLYYRNPYLLALTVVILLVAGLSAVQNLPRLEDPRITLRGATILTLLPGGSASRIEALINEKIEEELEDIPEIKVVESSATANVSVIGVELQDAVTKENNEQIFTEIRDRLSAVVPELPDGASTPFLDDKRGAAAYTFIVGLSWKGAQEPNLTILQRLATELQDQLLQVPATEFVRTFGGIQEEITVTVDHGEMVSAGLSPVAISQRIVATDSKVSAGQLRDDSANVKIEVNGGLDSVDRIRNIPLLTSPQNTTLTLGHIASVERHYQEPIEEYAVADGTRVIYVAARMEPTVRVDRWMENAQATLDSFQEKYANAVHAEVIFNQSSYTEERLAGLVSNLLAGCALVILVTVLTMGWKSALIVGAALPLSAAGAIFSLTFFGEQIHQMSIFGMIIAIGLLIDSAIVMSDEVRKQLLDGQPPIEAMYGAVHHLFVPLLASTVTTILGFMPIFLLPGNAGDFVSPIAISVVMALCFSFFIALTIIPALSARFGNEKKEVSQLRWYQKGVEFPMITDGFQTLLRAGLKRPFLSCALVAVCSMSGFSLMGTMDVEFFPSADRDVFEIQIWNQQGTSLTKTRKMVNDASEILAGYEDIINVHWMLGRSTPPVYYNQIPTEDNNPAYAQAVVKATSTQTASDLVPVLQDALNKKLIDSKVVVKPFGQGPPAVAPVGFRVKGSNVYTLKRLGDEIRAIMHRDDKIVQTRASIIAGEPQLQFDVDDNEIQRLGLRPNDIAGLLQLSLEGAEGGSILEDTEDLPVRVRYANDFRADLSALRGFPLTSRATNSWTPIEAVGSLNLQPELAKITRHGGQRSNNIWAYITPDAKAVSVSARVLEQIETTITLPPGYHIEVAGDSENQDEAVASLLIYAPVLVTMMIATLILAFRSVTLASIIGVVALFAVGFGMLALKISGYALGFNPLIGSIGLVGVAINDTIVILAAIVENKKAKAGDIEAIVAETFGCARHVITTTLTTIGGFIPLLLFTEGNFWPPLSVVIAGGLGFSIILAMFFTPVIYRAVCVVQGVFAPEQTEA